MKDRNHAIDILKGIGILLVLVAHSLGGVISKVAYTFHMPLFFIVCGLYFSYKEPQWVLKRDFNRLLVPAFFTIAIITVVALLKYVFPESYLMGIEDIFVNRCPVKQWDYIIIPGNLWFLFALFFAKLFFNLTSQFLPNEWFPFYSLIGGISAFFIGKFISIPLEVLVGLSVMPFMWIGYYIKGNGGVNNGIYKWMYLTIILWGIYVLFGHLRVDLIEYSWFYIPDIFAACGGTLLFYKISEQVEKRTTYLSKLLAFLGTYSLILICAPTIETYCFPMQEILPSSIPLRSIFVIGGKVAWCAISLYACINIPFLKKIFGVK